jgi:hypothetical protein
MRAILEAMLRLWRPHASSTDSYKELSMLMLDDKGDLTRNCLEDLRKLEGNKVKAFHVASEIKDLYHELSKIFHYREIDGAGMVVGGTLPLRAAVGIAFLLLSYNIRIKKAAQFVLLIRVCDDESLSFITLSCCWNSVSYVAEIVEETLFQQQLSLMKLRDSSSHTRMRSTN